MNQKMKFKTDTFWMRSGLFGNNFLSRNKGFNCYCWGVLAYLAEFSKFDGKNTISYPDISYLNRTSCSHRLKRAFKRLTQKKQIEQISRSRFILVDWLHD